MKHSQIIIYLVLVCTMASCTITGRISRREIKAQVIHSTPAQREVIEERKREYWQGYIEYTRVDSSKVFIIPTVTTPDGETMMQMEIETITVTASSRAVPERMGKVNLDFVVTLPKQLMGNCRGVEVVPLLHQEDGDLPLQPLTIRGALFNKVQERNYWQYERYLNAFHPDEAGRQWAYERFIYYPYPEGTRLDSVVTSKTDISYFYTQEVSTSESGNKLLISLDGKVQALDHSYYTFPLSDTLEYNVSSMLNFVDTTTRYVTRVIEKYAVVNDRSYLNFKVNRSDIIDTLGDNSTQLTNITKLMDEIINQKEFHIDSIILTASASPEGTIRKNNLLSKERAHALRSYLAKQFPRSRMDTLITVRWIGEDWTELQNLIRDDRKVRNREAIIKMIAENNDKDLDVLEKEIKRKYPLDYKYMLEHLYPQLRAVNFKYDLRRVGMVKDTIHTTVPDTLYARGVTLLKERKYPQSLRILEGFYDRNAAICMLSMGLDEKAYKTLRNLPPSSTNLYLTAVACVRTNRKDEALECFTKACELNENMKYRGRLDPEISELIEKIDGE